MIDPDFPVLHGRPPAGWVNDPNGCAHVDGRYHVFFQHNPRAAIHEGIGWGHVSSTDLVSWRQEPLALAPRAGELDSAGCFSGCLVMDDGVPTAVYSGVVDPAGGRAEVLLARGSADLRTWQQGNKPVAPLPDDPRIVELRDPFVLIIDGRRYAIQGGGRVGGPPQVLLYDATDLTHWRQLGVLLDGTDPIAATLAGADVWECPNLAQIDGHWVLLLSLWRHRPDGGFLLTKVQYLLGDLDRSGDAPRFVPVSGGEVDLGDCAYASQLLATDDRVLLWCWAQETRPLHDMEAAGWAGALTFPRELAVRDGTLISRLAPELGGLREEPPIPVEPEAALPGPAFEVEVRPGTGRVHLILEDETRQAIVATWDRGPDDPSRVVVDGSMVEVDDGRGSVSTIRAYPGSGGRWRLRCGADAAPRAWRLRNPAA